MHIFQEHYIVFNWIVDYDLEKNRSRSKSAIEAPQVEYNVKVVNRKGIATILMLYLILFLNKLGALYY